MQNFMILTQQRPFSEAAAESSPSMHWAEGRAHRNTTIQTQRAEIFNKPDARGLA